MPSLSARRPRVKPADVFTLSVRPICCCDLLPAGMPGLALINGGAYRLAYNADLPEAGEPVLYGYRLTSPAGELHDVPVDLSGCSCKGSTRWAGERGPLVCKHVRALTQFKAEQRLA